jgi:hypothetical protein
MGAFSNSGEENSWNNEQGASDTVRLKSGIFPFSSTQKNDFAGILILDSSPHHALYVWKVKHICRL